MFPLEEGTLIPARGRGAVDEMSFSMTIMPHSYKVFKF